MNPLNGGGNGKLDELRSKAEKLKAQIAELEAKETVKKRKDETRLKVLVGSAFLADIKHNPATREAVAAVLERGIVAPKDREFLKAQGWLQ
jgi:hypothetical protein